MSRPASTVVVSALALAAALASTATPAHAFLGFGAKRAAAAPAAAAAATAKSVPVSEPAAGPPRKATAAERAAAERLDPLTRAAFWSREADVDPTDTEAGTRFAIALRALGKYDEAVQASGRVLAVDPKNMTALMETAKAEIARNRAFYALEFLKRAEALAPRDWRPVSLEGVALEQSERPAEARVAYARALQFSPDNPAVLSNLALSYAAAGDRAQAEQLLRKAVRQPGAGAQERQNLALVLGLEGRVAEAEGLIRQDLPPESADNNIAWLKASNGPAGGLRSWDGVKGAEAGAPH